MSKYHIPLKPGCRYHLFNHAIGDELLFRNNDNFAFFLNKYAQHTSAICHTFSYALMPNHFHFAIKIRSAKECISHFQKVKEIAFDPALHNLSDFLMERFSNLCNSYAKSYNKVFNRKGSLFIDYLKRCDISTDDYLCNLINYIHFNPVHHGFCKNPLDWKWTSLHAFIANKKTRVKKEEALQIFGGLDRFKLAHVKMIEPLAEYEFL